MCTGTPHRTSGFDPSDRMRRRMGRSRACWIGVDHSGAAPRCPERTVDVSPVERLHRDPQQQRRAEDDVGHNAADRPGFVRHAPWSAHESSEGGTVLLVESPGQSS
jgi:hypothetical protein